MSRDLRILVGDQIPYRGLMEDAIASVLFPDLCEVIGKGRAWLKIASLKTLPGQKRAELVLNLRGKDYWFPLSKAVFERFKRLARTRSRGAGLRYLQEYIRRHRGYYGSWFGKVPANKYYWDNRLRDWSVKGRSQTLTGRQALRRDFASKPRRFAWQKKAEAQMASKKPPGEAQLPLVIAPKVGLDVSQVQQIIDALKSGSGYGSIARKLGISAKHAELVQQLMQHYGADAGIKDSIELALDRIVEGAEVHDVAAGLVQPGGQAP